jgi:hypothetical protein
MKTEMIDYNVVNDLYDEYIKGLTKDEVIELNSNVEKYTLENIKNNKFKKFLEICLPTFVCCMLLSIYFLMPISTLIFTLISFFTWVWFRLVSKEIKINEIIITGIKNDLQKYNLYKLNNSQTFDME